MAISANASEKVGFEEVEGGAVYFLFIGMLICEG